MIEPKVTVESVKQVGTMLVGVVIAVALVAITACATSQRRDDVLIQTARAFNDDWRWGRWDTMAGAMPKDDAKAFLARAQLLEAELELADFEVTSIKFEKDGGAATVLVKFEWYLKRDPRISRTTVEESWEFREGRWQVIKLRRTRGDRFGLVTEPVASPDGGAEQRGAGEKDEK